MYWKLRDHIYVSMVSAWQAPATILFPLNAKWGVKKC